MSQKPIVTRFPPSPTGYLHIGGARTALFNWLLTRRHGGKFILRIEDTDTQRSTPEATRAIIESMEWLGLDWDEGPYFQSQRYDLYNQTIEGLLVEGKAYHCHCSPEDLEKMREEASSRGLKPKYDGRCRDLGLGPSPGSVVRLKTPTAGSTRFNDLVKGAKSFDNRELDDLILRRSDGSPTYHLAVVADDIALGVNLIIRGEDHVMNTPRQIQIYQALGEAIPDYAHVPMILGPDKKRLSKRHGAMSVLAYRDMGYLPQALLNALVRLGWSYGDQEKFTMEEMIEKFSLENVGRSAGVFNTEKLLDLNAKYIQESDDEYLAVQVAPFLEKLGFSNIPENTLSAAVGTLKVRSKTLVEMAEKAAFYFIENVQFDSKASGKFLTGESRPILEPMLERLESLGSFTERDLEGMFSEFIEQSGMKMKVIAPPLRVALTGTTVSPGLFEVMRVLGKEKTIRRIERAIGHINEKDAGVG
ncbi:MAG TPA: glutamate--tRNA ligase [Desulfobacteraceae bacterium]|nr:glutamate--tRNA ligase [Desulfobacteraceae bacterium]